MGKLALSPLAGINEDADTKYQSALERIQAALTARENPSIDPVMLAMAQGFLNPGKTGSFAEGLGGAAGNVIPVMAQKQKEAMDNAQMRLQLAQAEREQANLTAATKGFRDITGGVSGQPSVTPAGQTPATPTTGADKGVGTPPDAYPVTIQKALDFAARFPNQKVLADKLMDAAKAGLDRYAMSQNGIVFDRVSGKYLNIEIPGQTQSAYSTPYGSFNMTPNDYAKFSKAQSAGLGQEWIEAYRTGKPFDVDSFKASGEKLEPSVEKPAPSDKQTPRMLSISEQEAKNLADKKLAEKTAEATVDTTTQVKTRGFAATGLIPLYNRAQGILKGNPKLKDSLGVLEKGDFTSAIGTVADEGVQVGSVKVNIPSFRKIASQYSQDPKTINDLAELAQIEAMWQFQQRQGLGSGTSVSNFEQQMVNQMGPNIKDPYDAYIKKLAFMKAKADFDREVGKKLVKGVQYEDFETTKEFEEMFDRYQKKIIPIVYGADTTKKPISSRSPKVSPNARAKLDEALNN
jgi:hypothetical protein